MRRFIIAAVASTVILSCASTRGRNAYDDAPCTPQKALKDHLQLKYSGRSAVVLARDHVEGWSGFVWKGDQLTEERYRFSNLYLGTPRVDLARGEQLLVVVTNTNPLIFSAAQTSASLVDREDIANIRALWNGLASVASAGLTYTEGAKAAERSFAASRQSGSAAPKTASVHGRSGNDKSKKPTPGPAADPTLADIASRTIARLQKERGQTEKAVQTLLDEANTAATLAESILKNEENALMFVTLVENGGPAGIRLADPPGTTSLAQDVAAAFRRVSDAHGEVLDSMTICPAQIAALQRALIYLTSETLPEASEKLKYNRDANSVSQRQSGCSTPQDLKDLGAWLSANLWKSDSPDSAVLRKLQREVDAYEAALTDRAAVIASAQQVLMADRVALIESAVAYRKLVELQKELKLDDDLCAASMGVLEVKRIARTEIRQPFDKNGSETFSVTLDPRFSGISTTHPRSVTGTYEVVARRDFDLDVDFAPVFTPLANPTFGVVTAMVEEPGPAGTITSVERKAIKRVKENSRAGQIAAFATVKFWRLTQFRPQFGASVSTDAPGLFGGIAYVPSRYFKVSTGWTMQKVTGLAKGLHEGQPITDASELQTRDIFDNDYYVAVSITIDNLPFFRKP